MRNSKLTPCQKIKREILLQAARNEHQHFNPLDTSEQVNDAWEMFLNEDEYHDYLSEFRSGQCETNISPEYSQHHASKSVATKLSDGTWVGWTYFYAGGKYGEPWAMPWMEDAYELTCVEEEKVVTVRTFTRVDENEARTP